MELLIKFKYYIIFGLGLIALTTFGVVSIYNAGANSQKLRYEAELNIYKAKVSQLETVNKQTEKEVVVQYKDRIITVEKRVGVLIERTKTDETLQKEFANCSVGPSIVRLLNDATAIGVPAAATGVNGSTN